MKPENIFESIPGNLDKEFFEQIIQSEHVKIERIISKGHRSPESGWFDQKKNEWVIVLRGEATIHFEDGDESHLKEGSHINIPAHTRHKVSWTDPETETIWLAVHY
ncbi:MAG: cupin [Nitrospira bacterium SG8_35_1]|nr:MAG: cupin [Nitrospira bacterium SG8_35_1]